jgi:hypothetical protein
MLQIPIAALAHTLSQTTRCYQAGVVEFFAQVIMLHHVGMADVLVCCASHAQFLNAGVVTVFFHRYARGHGRDSDEHFTNASSSHRVLSTRPL